MNVTLINSTDNLYQLETAGGRIVEYYRDLKNKYLIHIQLYDTETNTIEEITPERVKIDFIKVINGIWECPDIYYASFQTLDADVIDLSVFRYDPVSKEEQKILSLVRNMEVISGNTRIKVFVLSKSTVLIQTEERISGSDEKILGNIKFDLTLYNLDTHTETPVTDYNFINNGIHTMIPVSDKKIMVKTGYSYLEDARLGSKEAHESLIEGVYVTTTARFIADLTISADSVDMLLIESAYLDKYITLPFVTGNYTHFTVADPKAGTTKCVFYNHMTDERLEYTINGFQEDDLYVTYVIHSIPYVRRNGDSMVNFFNLLKAETDISFYDESFIDVTGKIFIMSPEKNPDTLHIYAYPGLNCVLKEKNIYISSCCLKDDHYIYIN